MDEEDRIRKAVSEKIGRVIAEDEKKVQKNLADDIISITRNIEKEDRMRKIVLGELIFVSDDSAKEVIDVSKEITEELVDLRE